MSRSVIPVILSGGSGTRLWPLSRERHPKQFLPLVTEHSLLQDTLLRLRGLEDHVDAPIVICNEAHRFLVAEQLREIGIAPKAIVLEPEGRNTAPAVAVAALLVQQNLDADEEPIFLVLPADHVILDAGAFCAAAKAAIQLASKGSLATFGVVPTRPETGYGYIRRGTDRGGWSAVEEFVEKPDLETARAYVGSGEYLWNSGMFVLPVGAYLAELGEHAPGMVQSCRAAVEGARVDRDFTRLGSEFLESVSDSIDYAVMEKTSKAAVVPLDAGWSDIGSWSALHEMLDKDSDGNVLRGDVINRSCKDSYIESNSRLVAAVGLKGVVIVETEDAVLIMAKADSQDVKQAVDVLKDAGRAEIGAGAPLLQSDESDSTT